MSLKSKFCSECGTLLEGNDRFCPVCGAKVIEGDEQNHEKSQTKNASSSPPPKKSRPQEVPYVSRSSEESIPSVTEEVHTLPSARFSYRIGAMLIDWSIVGFIGFILFIIVFWFMYEIINYRPSLEKQEFAIGIICIITIIIAWLYNASMETNKRQATIGKYLFGLKVTNKKGLRCSYRCATVRFVGKLISLALGGLGYLMIAFTKDKQALHDKLANTLVVEGEIKVEFMKKLLK